MANMSKVVEIVGADLTSSDTTTVELNKIASEEIAKKNTGPSGADYLATLGDAIANILGQSKYGKTDSTVVYQSPASSGLPTWLMPAAVAAGGLLLVMALKK